VCPSLAVSMCCVSAVAPVCVRDLSVSVSMSVSVSASVHFSGEFKLKGPVASTLSSRSTDMGRSVSSGDTNLSNLSDPEVPDKNEVRERDCVCSVYLRCLCVSVCICVCKRERGRGRWGVERLAGDMHLFPTSVALGFLRTKGVDAHVRVRVQVM